MLVSFSYLPVFVNRSVSDRKYYFLQLKENFLRYGFNYPDDRCFLLASYALHSDEVLGRDFDPREYFPTWVSNSKYSTFKLIV